jgi:MSHA pilin protein MshD
MSRRLCSGFSIVEVTVSIVLTGIMLTVALQTVSQSNLTQHRTLERARAGELARMLANEILQHSYVEPVAAATFGAESGETRATYDDVDDYNGLSESPPRYRDGTTVNGPRANTWRRTVSVTWANPITLADASPYQESGIKKITITVSRNNVPLATVTTLRSNAP